MINYDKNYIREHITIENIFELLEEWGAEPQYSSTGIIAETICHNPPGEGSRKLYFYENSQLFHCYTGCEQPSFDIFELIIKVANIQWNLKFDLNAAIRWAAQRFGIITVTEDIATTELPDWQCFENYDRIQNIKIQSPIITLKEYDETILDNLDYSLHLQPWLKDHISEQVMEEAQIGYCCSTDQITIPHFDEEGRFIGLRGRSMCQLDCDLWGKYRPIRTNGITYSHPLSFNLYNLNFSRPVIKRVKKAIIFESEKSCLQYRSYFGSSCDISVACCGSSVSLYQIEALIRADAREITIAFDRQFQEIGDKEFQKLKNNLLKIRNRYGHYTLISFIFDKNKITNYKDSPTDNGSDIFMKLYKERILI